MSTHSRHDGERHGAKQPERFDPARAAILDDAERFDYLPPAEIFALLDAPRGGLVVDFGAGTGAYALKLARARPDLIVIALDEQPEMLDLLRAKPEAKALANLKPAMPEDLSGIRGKADRVLALNVLHELGDSALKDLAMLLKPSAAALFVDWNAEAERPVGPPKDHVYGPREAIGRVEGFGFKIGSQRLFRYHYAFAAHRVHSRSR